MTRKRIVDPPLVYIPEPDPPPSDEPWSKFTKEELAEFYREYVRPGLIQFLAERRREDEGEPES